VDKALETLINTLRRENDRGVAPDLIFFTGDLAAKGKCYVKARSFFDDLLDATGLTARHDKLEARRRLFVVPGNHDVDRAKTEFLARPLTTKEQSDRFFGPDTVAARQKYFDRFGAYAAFFNEYFDGIRQISAEDHFITETIVLEHPRDNLRVGVLGLNSAWFSQDDQDRNQLWVGQRACDLALERVSAGEGADLLIALAHHPLTWLRQEDEMCVRGFLGRHYAVHLFGHDHCATTGLIMDEHGARLSLCTGALFEAASKPKRALWGTVDWPRREVRIRPIRHEDSAQVWTIDPSLYGDREEDGYCRTFALPHEEITTSRGAGAAVDPTTYIQALRDSCSHIEIHGLFVGSGRAQRVPIDDIYIALTTTPVRGLESGGSDAKARPPEGEAADSAPVELTKVLERQRVLIVGDPGSGKTTFLKRVAYGLCNTRLGLDAPTTAATLGLPAEALPLWVPVAELAEHVQNSLNLPTDHPTTGTDPGWIAHYIACRSKGAAGLPVEFWEEAMETGTAVVLLDGLDEAPTRQQRQAVAAMLAAAAGAYPRCRFVVASRPPAAEDQSVLPAFHHARINDLDEQEMERFLSRWCECLFSESPTRLKEHRDELLAALRARQDIRRMARTAVMLTAIAVVHWHEERLPEQRADLYDSVLIWLARSRQLKPERPTAEACLGLHQELALAMQRHPEGRQVQVPRRWAAEQIADCFDGGRRREQTDAAEAFLTQDELDSGIIVKRGDDIRFWHLTFQEYLAARAIAARPEDEQRTLLVATPKLYEPEWREVVLLLAGVLHRQGRKWKVDTFFGDVLNALGKKPKLPTQARCAGLLGAVLRDLSAVDYKPSDARYEKMMNVVEGIFDAERAKDVDIKVAIAAAEAFGQAGDPRFAGPLAPLRDANHDHWVCIPAGEFWMGAQNDERSGRNYDPEAWGKDSEWPECPVHQVNLSEFRIGRYPVTVCEYALFVDDGGYGQERFWTAGGFGEEDKPGEWETQLEHPTRPVVYVSWHEACAYAAWATVRLREAGHEGDVRLPTEAEWERAARGTEGCKFPWGGDEPNDRLMNYGQKVGNPTPVGVYPLGASPEGICDLAGNVWEWCQDHYHDSYDGAPADGSAWEDRDADSPRVWRGGGWVGIPQICRAASRGRLLPVDRYDVIGFRVLCSLSGVHLRRCHRRGVRPESRRSRMPGAWRDASPGAVPVSSQRGGRICAVKPGGSGSP